MNVLITICARAGSKGIPGKNIKPINGIPLLVYTLKSAKKFSDIFQGQIAISTDDPTVKEIAASLGVISQYVRPDFLATDSAGKVDTIYDLLLFEEKVSSKKFDFILDLDITSPLRTLDDLLNAFDLLKSDELAHNIFSVNIANKNPYFNMVEKKKSGYFGLVKTGNFMTRQSATPVYEMNASFYFYRRDFFELQDRKVVNEKSLMYCMNHICFDLDHPVDFEFMAYLIENNKLGFEF
jgi:CMP-N,N'-diacetyllegionaminic acid synthase